MLDYLFTVRPLAEDEGSGWLVEFPDLPGCMADCATPEEAIREAEDAARSYIETLRELGRPLPEPTRNTAGYSGRWVIRAPKSLHRRLTDRAKLDR